MDLENFHHWLLSNKIQFGVIPGQKTKFYELLEKISLEELQKIRSVLNNNYNSKFERLRFPEKNNYLCQIYKIFKFPKIHLLKIVKNVKNSGCDLNRACDNAAEFVKDLNILLTDSFQKFSKHEECNPKSYFRQHLPYFIRSINQIIQNHENPNFPIRKKSKTSELVECCWKVENGKDERYLEVKFFEKPTEVGGLEFHEVVSIGVIGKKRFKSYYKRTTKASFDNYLFVPQNKILSSLQQENILPSILEDERQRLDNIPLSYWHVEENTGPLQPIPGSTHFFHSKTAPCPDAFLIKFDDNSKIRSLEELEEEYYRQKPADLIYDEDYEPLETTPENNLYWDEFVNQEILEKGENNKNCGVENEISLKDYPIKVTFKLDSKDEGPYHILIRHWDQFEQFLEVHKKQSLIGKKLCNLYSQILQKQKEKDDFDEDLDQDPKIKIVELEEQMKKISEDNKDLITSLQQKLVNRLSQLLNHDNCSGGQFKSSHNTNIVLNYQISFGENRKRCLYVILSGDKNNGYSLKTAYFVAHQYSKLAFDGLGYWYDMEKGKIVVRNRRDFENPDGFDMEDQSMFTSPLVCKKSPHQLLFHNFDYKEVITSLFLSQSLLSIDKFKSYVITGISDGLIATIKQCIINFGAKKKGEIRASAIEFDLECSKENEEALKKKAESMINQIMSPDNRLGVVTSKTGGKIEFYQVKNQKWVLICSEKMINGSEEVQKSIRFKTWKEIE